MRQKTDRNRPLQHGLRRPVRARLRFRLRTRRKSGAACYFRATGWRGLRRHRARAYVEVPREPAAIGEPETIGYRTSLFFAMLVISIAALSIAVMLGGGVSRRATVPGTPRSWRQAPSS